MQSDEETYASRSDRAGVFVFPSVFILLEFSCRHHSESVKAIIPSLQSDIKNPIFIANMFFTTCFDQ